LIKKSGSDYVSERGKEGYGPGGPGSEKDSCYPIKFIRCTFCNEGYIKDYQ